MSERHDEGPHEHDRGLSYDLPVLARRRMIRLMAGASLIPLVGCTSQEEAPASSASPASSAGSSSSSSAACA
ncbi:intradiol ring-cleavage dioxygenase, partial [Streptomyces olindensis]